MNLSKKELIQKWRVSWAQYNTIDRSKCERLGTLAQGFFGTKTGKDAAIYPFLIYKKSDVEEIEKIISNLKTEYLGISFVQHYIHYS